MYYATLVQNTPKLFKLVLQIIAQVNDKRSPRAAWIAEFTCKQDISIIFPHLDSFIDIAPKVHLDSAVRPVAKICEYLTKVYFSENSKVIPQHLYALSRKHISQQHLDAITELCFDWLISNHKVAVKAYAMYSLLELGRQQDWIHDELINIIEKDYQSGSAAFKARSRHTLIGIKKHRKILKIK